MHEHITSSTTSVSRKRTYRSHSSPACLACRKRKSRCMTRTEGESCVSCELHDTECRFPAAEYSISAPRNPSQRDQSISTPAEDSETYQQAGLDSSARFAVVNHERAPSLDPVHDQSVSQIEGEHSDETSHVVSPALAEDNEILQSYLADPANPRMKRIISRSESSKIILFTTVPRRPVGTTQNQSLAASKCEIIEKLIGPYTSDILKLYLQCANKCFPVFDDSAFRQILADDQKRLSRALIANLYANALTYWKNSHILSSVPKPDQRFMWVLANEALHSELFLSPGISTIIASLLNIGGRPSTSLFGNGSLIGSTIGLANALGLNRDPSTWNITTSEKSFRIRIWWIVLVYDRWCSLAYGTPLQVNRLQHNVPLPGSMETTTHSEDTYGVAPLTVFNALLSLTEVLGLYLESMYRIDKDYSLPVYTAIEFDDLLRLWENRLDDKVRRAVLLGEELEVAGIPNLRLGYLAVKMLLRRIQLKSETENGGNSTQYFEIQALQAASLHVSFLSQLRLQDLQDFWLPMYAQSLTSVVTFLLRIALKHKEDSPNANLELARNMMAILKAHLDNGWDLAADCVSVCQPIFQKVEALLATTSPLPSVFGDLSWSLDENLYELFPYNGPSDFATESRVGTL